MFKFSVEFPDTLILHKPRNMIQPSQMLTCCSLVHSQLILGLLNYLSLSSPFRAQYRRIFLPVSLTTSRKAESMCFT